MERIIYEMQNGDYTTSLRGRGISEGINNRFIGFLDNESMTKIRTAQSQYEVNAILRGCIINPLGIWKDVYSIPNEE